MFDLIADVIMILLIIIAIFQFNFLWHPKTLYKITYRLCGLNGKYYAIVGARDPHGAIKKLRRISNISVMEIYSIEEYELGRG